MTTTVRLDVTGSLPLWEDFREGKGMHFSSRVEFSLQALETVGRKYSNWCVPFSGGKDSGAVASFVATAIRKKWVTPPKKLLILRSDTGQELPELDILANEFLDRLGADGFDARTVAPARKNKFYMQVLGKGLLPVVQGMKGRWCTRALKVDPMKEAMETIYKETGEKFLLLSGVRMGESTARDIKLVASSEKATEVHFPSCSSESGECGVGGIWMDKTLATCYDALPIIVHWSTCMVFDWLQGWIEMQGELGHHYTEITRKIATLYGQSADGKIEGMSRYGCIGCSAISKDKMMLKAVESNASLSPILALSDIWEEMRGGQYRHWNAKTGKKGCLTLKARAFFFEKVKAIHTSSGIDLISAEEEEMIRSMWVNKVYPRGYTGQEPTSDVVARETDPQQVLHEQ
jgi:DNA sulfur modification protein DndC